MERSPKENQSKNSFKHNPGPIYIVPSDICVVMIDSWHSSEKGHSIPWSIQILLLGSADVSNDVIGIIASSWCV